MKNENQRTERIPGSDDEGKMKNNRGWPLLCTRRERIGLLTVGFLLLLTAGIQLLWQHLQISSSRSSDWPPSVRETYPNLNTAGRSRLETLPGIGPHRAKAIVTYRTEHGPFQSYDELLNIHGIGPKTLKKIKSQSNLIPPE